ncbi:MAG: hypothetical protein NTU53_03145 [Planctomycetota bacterium]|nr:hypothetical protein [Planctomycetota bacterium]
MVAIKAHFDGKTIVPDEPVNLPANQRLIVHVQPVSDHPTDFRSWIGLGNAAPQNPAPRFKSHRDLWE